MDHGGSPRSLEARLWSMVALTVTRNVVDHVGSPLSLEVRSWTTVLPTVTSGQEVDHCSRDIRGPIVHPCAPHCH